MFKIARQVYLLSLFVFLTACGSIQTSQVAIEDTAVIVVKSKTLVGKTLITNKRTIQIQEDYLTDYKASVAGAADREVEGLQVMSLLVEPGMQKIELMESNKVVFKTSVYVGSGQTREIYIR